MLLERATELKILDGVLTGLDASGGKVVLIRGEAGIGKSSLVNEFIESRSDEVHVHLGACDDLLIPQPLGPFWDMARAESSLKEPLDNGDRPRVLELVLDLLSRSLRPTIAVIEDTHWADEATLDAIKFLGRRIARSNGLLVLTYRDGEVDYDHPLRGVIGDLPAQSVVRIQLGGLSLSAVASIVAESELDPDEVMAATNGNPFLVTEMASVEGGAVPSSLQDSVTARAQKLSIGAHEMLKTLSVIPEPIPRVDALGFAVSDESRLDECERRGLLDVGAEMVGFRHDLIRRAIESTLTGSERIAKSRTVLDELPEETHAFLLLHCAVEANDIERLVDLAPRSARYAAAMGSHIQAAEDFRELRPHLNRLEPDVRGPILDEWAREELLVDNVPGAIKLAEAAVAHYQSIGDKSGESGALAQWRTSSRTPGNVTRPRNAPGRLLRSWARTRTAQTLPGRSRSALICTPWPATCPWYLTWSTGHSRPAVQTSIIEHSFEHSIIAASWRTSPTIRRGWPASMRPGDGPLKRDSGTRRAGLCFTKHGRPLRLEISPWPPTTSKDPSRRR